MKQLWTLLSFRGVAVAVAVARVWRTGQMTKINSGLSSVQSRLASLDKLVRLLYPRCC